MNDTKLQKGQRQARALKDILVILGGLVVLSTFVANELKRDRLKDLSNSIETARTIYLLRSGFQTTNDLIKGIENRLENKHPQLPTDAQDQKRILDMLALQYEYPDFLRNKAALEAISDLRENLPASDSEAKREVFLSETLSREEKLTKDRRAKFFHLGKLSREELKRMNATVSNDEAALEDKEKDLTEDTFDDAISEFGENVMTRARDIQTQDEKSADSWRHIGYILFAIGSLIAVIGQMLGIKYGEG